MRAMPTTAYGQRSRSQIAVELVDPLLGNREHVALLRFVGPDLHGRHARLLDVHLAKLDVRADAAGMGELGERIGQAARADVVDGEDRVRLSHLPARVDDFLAAALELGVGALHRIEVERLGVGAARHRGGRAAAHADEEARAAELHEHRLRVERLLGDVLRREVAQAARQHDGLVVAAHLARDLHLEGAEVSREVRPPELVVVGRTPDGALDHDRERRGDAAGLAVVAFPGLALAGEVEVRDGETGEPGLGLGARSRRALVADLAAGARSRARMRRDGGGVVVRLHLHQDVRRVAVVAPPLLRVGIEAVDLGAFHHGGIVRVRHDRAARVQRRGCCGSSGRGDLSSALPSMVHEALKILCRQCSLLACANIISSTSVGLRPIFPKLSRR